MNKITFVILMLLVSFGYSQSPTLPLDFESTTITYTFDDFSGGQSTVITNPQSSGINTSANVAQMVKGVGDPWAGSYLDLAGAIDFSTTRTFKVKVFSPRIGARLLLKVEDSNDGNIAFEIEDTVQTANAWEELSFDFSWISQTEQYDRIVFIFDIGLVGDGSPNSTYLFDDIELVDEGPYLARVELPITFDDTTIAYSLIDFGGANSKLVPDPNGSSNTVARSAKSLGSATWAGTTMSSPGGFPTPLPITASATKMNLRVYAPKSGIPVRLKIEDANDPTKSVETQVNTTVGNAWETLEFDFNNEAMGTAALNPGYTFNMASIFFHFGTEGVDAGADTVFYWDDVRFGEAANAIEDAEKFGLTYYPNPFEDQLVIEAERKIDNILIFDALGREVFFSKMNNKRQVFDLSFLDSGLYVVRLGFGENVAYIRCLKQ